MKRTNILAVAFATVAALGLGACGDSTVPNTPLTDAQVDEMVDAMSSIGFMPSGGGLAALRASSSVKDQASAISLTVDENVNCPVSGTIHISGSFNINETTNSFSMNVKEKHQACAATAQQTGKTWTFDGKPDVTLILNVTTTNVTTGAGTMSGTEKGAIAFSTDGLAGTCQIDLSINATTNDAGVTTGAVTGTVCGKDVSQQFTDPAV